jgi:hypothetical protein
VRNNQISFFMFLFESTLPPPPTLIRRKTAQKWEKKKEGQGEVDTLV